MNQESEDPHKMMIFWAEKLPCHCTCPGGRWHVRRPSWVRSDKPGLPGRSGIQTRMRRSHGRPSFCPGALTCRTLESLLNITKQCQVVFGNCWKEIRGIDGTNDIKRLVTDCVGCCILCFFWGARQTNISQEVQSTKRVDQLLAPIRPMATWRGSEENRSLQSLCMATCRQLEYPTTLQVRNPSRKPTRQFPADPFSTSPVFGSFMFHFCFFFS